MASVRLVATALNASVLALSLSCPSLAQDTVRLEDIYDDPAAFMGQTLRVQIRVNPHHCRPAKEIDSSGNTVFDGYLLSCQDATRAEDSADRYGNSAGLLRGNLNIAVANKAMARDLKEKLIANMDVFKRIAGGNRSPEFSAVGEVEIMSLKINDGQFPMMMIRSLAVVDGGGNLLFPDKSKDLPKPDAVAPKPKPAVDVAGAAKFADELAGRSFELRKIHKAYASVTGDPAYVACCVLASLADYQRQEKDFERAVELGLFLPDGDKMTCWASERYGRERATETLDSPVGANVDVFVEKYRKYASCLGGAYNFTDEERNALEVARDAYLKTMNLMPFPQAVDHLKVLEGVVKSGDPQALAKAVMQTPVAYMLVYDQMVQQIEKGYLLPPLDPAVGMTLSQQLSYMWRACYFLQGGTRALADVEQESERRALQADLDLIKAAKARASERR